jgi:hypothetical protein
MNGGEFCCYRRWFEIIITFLLFHYISGKQAAGIYVPFMRRLTKFYYLISKPRKAGRRTGKLSPQGFATAKGFKTMSKAC